MLRTTARRLCAVAFAAGLGIAAFPAWGQAYPSSPVHLIVAYAAGGTGDVVARIIAPKLSIALGQSVIVENRAGASGAIGAHSVATATPDGLTLLIGQTAEVAINQHWLKGAQLRSGQGSATGRDARGRSARSRRSGQGAILQHG